MQGITYRIFDEELSKALRRDGYFQKELGPLLLRFVHGRLDLRDIDGISYAVQVQHGRFEFQSKRCGVWGVDDFVEGGIKIEAFWNDSRAFTDCTWQTTEARGHGDMQGLSELNPVFLLL